MGGRPVPKEESLTLGSNGGVPSPAFSLATAFLKGLSEDWAFEGQDRTGQAPLKSDWDKTGFDRPSDPQRQWDRTHASKYNPE